jgi:hypothetical protein
LKISAPDPSAQKITQGKSALSSNFVATGYVQQQNQFQKFAENISVVPKGFQGTMFWRAPCHNVISLMEGYQMKKILIATAMTLMCSAAFAQGSTGANHETTNNPGTPKAGTTNNMNSGTTGTGMQKEGMSKEGMKNDSMSQGGASKDGQGQMNKGGMSK